MTCAGLGRYSATANRLLHLDPEPFTLGLLPAAWT